MAANCATTATSPVEIDEIPVQIKGHLGTSSTHGQMHLVNEAAVRCARQDVSGVGVEGEQASLGRLHLPVTPGARQHERPAGALVDGQLPRLAAVLVQVPLNELEIQNKKQYRDTGCDVNPNRSLET